MLLAGAAVMVVALGVLAISFSSTTGTTEGPALGRSSGIAALIAMNVFAIAFGITWGPVMWVMLSEPLPLQFADFAERQREAMSGEALETALRYWREELRGPLPVLELPTDPAPTGDPFAGDADPGAPRRA